MTLPGRWHLSHLSLYRRLMIWLLCPLAVLVAIMLLQAWFASREAADRAFDRLLDAASLSIAEQVRWQQNRLWMDLPPSALEMLATDASERVFYALYDAHGDFVTGNRSLPSLPASDSGQMSYGTVTSDGMAVRLGVLRSRLEGWDRSDRFEVRVAQTLEGREALANRLFLSSLINIVIIAVLAVAVVLLSARFALEPLTRLRRAIRQRNPRTLAPLELPLPRELAELRRALNELLARMRRVRANQERFIGDASHQLRTPLAGLSARAELALRQTDPADWHAALTTMHDTVTKTARLAGQLLSLTRLNNPEATPARAPLSLSALAQRVVRESYTRYHRRGVDLGVELPVDEVTVSATDWQLEEALNNLIENAANYGATQVTVRVDMAPPRLSVEDDGPGIPESQRLLVLRPFHRGEETGSGTGLGLAIVDSIARAHDIHLSLRDARPDHPARPGLCVELGFLDDSNWHTATLGTASARDEAECPEPDTEPAEDAQSTSAGATRRGGNDGQET
ncbi:sensor histidine kinase [Salinicola rhizosphaerae]|uniref:histidine kinase n=1 Tax=Salinicola rhizosphaerae TaxID=1443141 RepID=A0ABQ3E7W3_9GAMM|nr:sensor histidine kinase [Salinicola rhizosphaerae]GHB29448.1 sensor histidine kinase [Salinicola rhizosphaerae]